MVSREVRIVDAFKVFLDTIAIYQNAVSFLIDVVNEHYDTIRSLPSQKAMTLVERLVHSTSTRKALYPSFDGGCRRYALQEEPCRLGSFR